MIISSCLPCSVEKGGCLRGAAVLSFLLCCRTFSLKLLPGCEYCLRCFLVCLRYDVCVFFIRISVSEVFVKERLSYFYALGIIKL